LLDSVLIALINNIIKKVIVVKLSLAAKHRRDERKNPFNFPRPSLERVDTF
jgi:hypothetical protein